MAKSNNVVTKLQNKEFLSSMFISQLSKLGLNLEKRKQPEWTKWKDAVEKIINPEKLVRVAMVGKYLDIGDFQLTDSYLSINEALKHSGVSNNAKIEINWVDSKVFEENIENTEKPREFDGLIIPGGFGNTGVEGKINAIKFARENNMPYLRLCLGLQLAVIEFARNICNLYAHITEINPYTPNPVIDILAEQKNIEEKGGTMRLRAYKAVLKESKVRQIYNLKEVYERHRHRYEVNPQYHQILQEKGILFSGMSPDNKLVEFIELPIHSFFIATQAHPEFKSSLLKPSPLFDRFVKACLISEFNNHS